MQYPMPQQWPQPQFFPWTPQPACYGFSPQAAFAGALPFSTAPTVAAPVFQSQQPWVMSPAQHVTLCSTLDAEAEQMRPNSPPMVTPATMQLAALAQVEPIEAKDPPGLAALVKSKSGKAGKAERQYTLEEYRAMLDRVVCRAKSAPKAAQGYFFKTF